MPHIRGRLPQWAVWTGWAVPVLSVLFAFGTWVNFQWMDQEFINEVEAGEAHEALMQKIERSNEALVSRIKRGDDEDDIQNIEVRLEVINVELNWLSSIEEKTSYHDQRIRVLRAQQEILLERLEELR